MRISTEWRNEYLFVHAIDGNRSFSNLRGYWQAVLDGLAGRSQRQALVVDELTGPTSAHEVIALVGDVVVPGLKGARIAFVNPNPGTPELVQFAEVLARRGGVTARMFTTVEGAEEWLRGLAGGGPNVD